MKLTDLFLDDLEREAPGTRKVLARVPDGSYDWKPHERSMTMGRLSVLVATMPVWIASMVNEDGLDFAPGGQPRPQPELRTSEQLLQAFEECLGKARDALKSTTDEHLQTNWKLFANERLVIDQPRHIQIRDGVLTHLAHHRGQLTVYLRLNGALVPAVYGPSADEYF
jgi:uncharacterized damage-inducible protein DinB